MDLGKEGTKEMVTKLVEGIREEISGGNGQIASPTYKHPNTSIFFLPFVGVCSQFSALTVRTAVSFFEFAVAISLLRLQCCVLCSLPQNVSSLRSSGSLPSLLPFRAQQV